MKSTMLNAIFAVVLILGSSFKVNAGMIDPASMLLDESGATLLEGWLGQGDLDFDRIWYGETGATAASWHDAVDGVLGTITIFEMVDANGDRILVGGHTILDWGLGNLYQRDDASFIFNLINPEIQYSQVGQEQNSIYVRDDYFATFGAGHDIVGGWNLLGSNYGNTSHPNYTGYTYSYSYDLSQGQISVAGDSGIYGGDSGLAFNRLTTVAMETFTYQAAAVPQVPEPSTIAVFAFGLFGLMLRKLKR